MVKVLIELGVGMLEVERVGCTGLVTNTVSTAASLTV